MTGVSNSPDDPRQQVDRDELLSELLSELSEKAANGEHVDILEVCKSHPDLADELKDLWGAVMIADAVGSDVSDATVDSSPVNADITAAFGIT